MNTYTIAFTTPSPDGSCLLLATVLDGTDIAAAVKHEIETAGLNEDLIYETQSGLILTDAEPDDESRIIWRGHDCGWLMDENDVTWNFAITA